MRQHRQDKDKMRRMLTKLLSKLDDEKASVKIEAMHQLSSFGSIASPAIERLAKFLFEGDEYLRLTAMQTLISIGLKTKRVSKYLRSVVKEDPYSFVQIRIYWILERIEVT